MYMYLKHNIMKDIVRECFSLSALTLEVVMELPDNPCHGFPSSFDKGGLVLFEEGVQVNVF